MDLRQNPLLGDDDIPSPMFKAQPGWGGQLGGWFRENAFVLIFRTVLAASVVLITLSLVRARPAAPVALVTPSPTPLPAQVQTAARGDTLASLAARALSGHLSLHPEHKLNAAQQMFITDALWRSALAVQSTQPFVLEVGMEIRFPTAALEATIAEAKLLTPAQLAAWSRLLK